MAVAVEWGELPSEPQYMMVGPRSIRDHVVPRFANVSTTPVQHSALTPRLGGIRVRLS
jgi:hypothetical protein